MATNTSFAGGSISNSMKLFASGSVHKIDLTIGPYIASGSFGSVHHAQCVEYGKVAAKLIPLSLIHEHDLLAYVQHEINICKKLKHPNIVRTYDATILNFDRSFRDKVGPHEPMDPKTKGDCLAILMEMVPGGDLFDKVKRQRRLDQNTARRIFQQVVSGLVYLHSLLLVHRDLKAENILIGGMGEVKLCDFGLCCAVVGDDNNNSSSNSNSNSAALLLKSQAGSVDYQAPEVIGGDGYFGFSCDVWSTGVLLFMMLVGQLPFHSNLEDPDEADAETERKILEGKFDHRDGCIPPQASELLLCMLTVDVEKRCTLLDVVRHPWFQMGLMRPSIEDLERRASAVYLDHRFLSSPSLASPQNALMLQQQHNSSLDNSVNNNFIAPASPLSAGAASPPREATSTVAGSESGSGNLRAPTAVVAAARQNNNNAAAAAFSIEDDDDEEFAAEEEEYYVDEEEEEAATSSTAQHHAESAPPTPTPSAKKSPGSAQRRHQQQQQQNQGAAKDVYALADRLAAQRRKKENAAQKKEQQEPPEQQPAAAASSSNSMVVAMSADLQQVIEPNPEQRDVEVEQEEDEEELPAFGPDELHSPSDVARLVQHQPSEIVVVASSSAVDDQQEQQREADDEEEQADELERPGSPTFAASKMAEEDEEQQQQPHDQDVAVPSTAAVVVESHQQSEFQLDDQEEVEDKKATATSAVAEEEVDELDTPPKMRLQPQPPHQQQHEQRQEHAPLEQQQGESIVSPARSAASSAHSSAASPIVAVTSPSQNERQQHQGTSFHLSPQHPTASPEKKQEEQQEEQPQQQEQQQQPEETSFHLSPTPQRKPLSIDATMLLIAIQATGRAFLLRRALNARRNLLAAEADHRTRTIEPQLIASSNEAALQLARDFIECSEQVSRCDAEKQQLVESMSTITTRFSQLLLHENSEFIAGLRRDTLAAFPFLPTLPLQHAESQSRRSILLEHAILAECEWPELHTRAAELEPAAMRFLETEQSRLLEYLRVGRVMTKAWADEAFERGKFEDIERFYFEQLWGDFLAAETRLCGPHWAHLRASQLIAQHHFCALHTILSNHYDGVVSQKGTEYVVSVLEPQLRTVMVRQEQDAWERDIAAPTRREVMSFFTQMFSHGDAMFEDDDDDDRTISYGAGAAGLASENQQQQQQQNSQHMLQSVVSDDQMQQQFSRRTEQSVSNAVSGQHQQDDTTTIEASASGFNNYYNNDAADGDDEFGVRAAVRARRQQQQQQQRIARRDLALLSGSTSGAAAFAPPQSPNAASVSSSASSSAPFFMTDAKRTAIEWEEMRERAEFVIEASRRSMIHLRFSAGLDDMVARCQLGMTQMVEVQNRHTLARWINGKISDTIAKHSVTQCALFAQATVRLSAKGRLDLLQKCEVSERKIIVAEFDSSVELRLLQAEHQERQAREALTAESELGYVGLFLLLRRSSVFEHLWERQVAEFNALCEAKVLESDLCILYSSLRLIQSVHRAYRVRRVLGASSAKARFAARVLQRVGRGWLARSRLVTQALHEQQRDRLSVLEERSRNVGVKTEAAERQRLQYFISHTLSVYWHMQGSNRRTRAAAMPGLMSVRSSNSLRRPVMQQETAAASSKLNQHEQREQRRLADEDQDDDAACEIIQLDDNDEDAEDLFNEAVANNSKFASNASVFNKNNTQPQHYVPTAPSSPRKAASVRPQSARLAAAASSAATQQNQQQHQNQRPASARLPKSQQPQQPQQDYSNLPNFMRPKSATLATTTAMNNSSVGVQQQHRRAARWETALEEEKRRQEAEQQERHRAANEAYLRAKEQRQMDPRSGRDMFPVRLRVSNLAPSPEWRSASMFPSSKALPPWMGAAWSKDQQPF